MRVVREILFSRWYAIPFQIEWMSLGQIERVGTAPERFRDSFEGHGVFFAGRLPCLFFDVVDVYFAHLAVVAGVSPALVRFAADTAASTTIGEISLLAVEIISFFPLYDDAIRR